MNHYYNKLKRGSVNEILTLRKQGLSYHLIGIIYQRHHTTIIHHCQKHKVTIEGTDRFAVKDLKRIERNPDGTYVITEKGVNIIEPIDKMALKYDSIIEEKINKTKTTYADYLKSSNQKVYNSWKVKR